MVWLNLLFLFFVTLISFGTALEIEFGFFRVVFVIFAVILTSAGSLLALIWLHASRNKMLIDNYMTSRQIKAYSIQYDSTRDVCCIYRNSLY